MIGLAFVLLGISATPPDAIESPPPWAAGTMLAVKAPDHVVALVESDAAEDACGKAIVAAAKAGLSIGGSHEPAACTEEVIAKLTNGTRVTVLEKREECAPRLLKVKVTSGKSEGKTGCLSAKSLEAPPDSTSSPQP